MIKETNLFGIVVNVCVCLIVAWAGLGLVNLGSECERLGKESLEWVPTDAKVVRCEINTGFGAPEKIRVSLNKGVFGIAASLLGPIILHSITSGLQDEAIILEYEYLVEGSTYQCGNYSYNWVLSNQMEREKYTADHPEDSTITVYYNPTNPTEAVIQRGVSIQCCMATSWLGKALLLFTGLFLIIGALSTPWQQMLSGGKKQINYQDYDTISTVASVVDFKKGCALLLIAGTIWGGNWLVGYYKDLHKKAIASKNWTVCEGEVVENSSHKTYSGKKSGKLLNLTQTTVTVFSCSYNVDDKDYRCSMVSFEGSEDTTAFAAEHPLGTNINVHYNPDDPAEAVLVPGPSMSNYQLGLNIGHTVIGVGLVFLGVALWRFMPREIFSTESKARKRTRRA